MPLKPEFVADITDALSKVSTADIGPLEESRSIADLGLDSMALVELLAMLEEKMQSTIDDRQLGDLQTLGDLQRLLDSGSRNTPPG